MAVGGSYGNTGGLVILSLGASFRSLVPSPKSLRPKTLSQSSASFSATSGIFPQQPTLLIFPINFLLQHLIHSRHFLFNPLRRLLSNGLVKVPNVDQVVIVLSNPHHSRRNLVVQALVKDRIISSITDQGGSSLCCLHPLFLGRMQA